MHGGQYVFFVCWILCWMFGVIQRKEKNTKITIKKNVNVLFKKSFISSGVGYSFVNQITTTVYK